MIQLDKHIFQMGWFNHQLGYHVGPQKRCAVHHFFGYHHSFKKPLQNLLLIPPNTNSSKDPQVFFSKSPVFFSQKKTTSPPKKKTGRSCEWFPMGFAYFNLTLETDLRHDSACSTSDLGIDGIDGSRCQGIVGEVEIERHPVYTP